MKQVITILAILLAFNASSQKLSTELITDRPDQTESAAVVPLKSLQIETGFVLANDENNLWKQTNTTYNTTLLRYGLLNNLELRLAMEYNKDKFEFKSNDSTSTISGFSPISLGFKVKIMEEDGWRPELALLGGIGMPFSAGDDYKSKYTSGGMRFSFAHTLSKVFSIGYNIGVEWDGNHAFPGYFYSLAPSASITDKIGVFVELFGIFYEDNNAEHLLDGGITYLITTNLQIDLSGGIGLNEDAIDNFISVGLSLRLPK